MANLTIATTPRQDSAIKRKTDAHNEALRTALTPAQFAQQEIIALINRWVDQTEEQQRLTKAQAYQNATSEDQAMIDSILAKYGG